MKREQAQRVERREKVKHFFGYKVNEIELATIESRLKEYIQKAAEEIHEEADSNIYSQPDEGDAYLEIPPFDLIPPIEKAFRNFEKWLADETWRRPVVKLRMLRLSPTVLKRRFSKRVIRQAVRKRK